MAVRVEYDRSNRVYLYIQRTGNRPSHAVAQGANFSIGAGPSAPPSAGAGAGTGIKLLCTLL